VVIDANGNPAEVAAAIRAHLPADVPVTAPRRSAVPAGFRTLILAVGSLAAGATVLGYQILECC